MHGRADWIIIPNMRLNFWQWLGLILLIGAGAYWIYEQKAEREAGTSQQTTQAEPAAAPPTTVPSAPTTAPAAP